MWDPKPDAPSEIRGPFGHIPTKVPGIHVCEHLPLTAKIMDRLTLIRSVDCSASNHTPITKQACNPLARRTDDGRDGAGWPSMGSIAAKYRGANAPGIPGYIALADSLKADVWGAGHMGGAFQPVSGTDLSGQLKLAAGLRRCDVGIEARQHQQTGHPGNHRDDVKSASEVVANHVFHQRASPRLPACAQSP